MAEQRIAELEKQNIELNTKFSQTFNELQKYKRLSETQKISINNLQTEKTDLLLNQKKTCNVYELKITGLTCEQLFFIFIFYFLNIFVFYSIESLNYRNHIFLNFVILVINGINIILDFIFVPY